ncbi:hypothetical protein [Halocalculus aciditolerans]|uniref:Uncharacterized protein n=1 Tax=Halocalculus aciditolerans TaxID=1383812 RepID=A0A830F333_9EURY|nr:hypothetical protein [Halocalculus aciditolerans]GGL57894.1 hypothetical protein GCM10009039_15090 [Halocalculus aciditolerans]
MGYNIDTVHEKDEQGCQETRRIVESTDATGETSQYPFLVVEENGAETHEYVGDGEAPDGVHAALATEFEEDQR